MPAYAQAAGVGPIAVADELWFQPTKSAVCGMCLKISISPGTPSPTCTDSTAQTATCPGSGTTPYTSVNQPWAWNATVYPADANNPLPYFIAVIIEWFDRNQTLPYEVTYPTQNVSTDAFGTWPIIYEGIECPVGNYKLQYHFENVSTVIGTANSSLCDNELNAPCGTVQADERPFAYLAFKAIGERIPLAAMQVRLFPNASWLDMARSGADYWQINDYATVPAVLDPTNPLQVGHLTSKLRAQTGRSYMRVAWCLLTCFAAFKIQSASTLLALSSAEACEQVSLQSQNCHCWSWYYSTRHDLRVFMQTSAIIKTNLYGPPCILR
ncbi:TPA: hypothetical protein ACH3X3_014630 [Trebouxia sp. C0006]